MSINDDTLLLQNFLSTPEEISSSVNAGLLTELENNYWLTFSLSIALLTICLTIYSELHFQYLAHFYSKCLNEVVDAPSSPNPFYEGRLVVLVGKLQLKSPVYFNDPVFPFVEITGSILIKREVEMLQWSQNKDSYEKQWHSVHVANKHLEFVNPDWENGFKSEFVREEAEVFVCDIQLCAETVKMLPVTGILQNIQPYFINEEVKSYFLTADSVYYYLSKEKFPHESKVGDYRLRYFGLEMGIFVTVLGQYTQGSIGKYKNQLLVVQTGLVSVDVIIENILAQKRLRQNIFRALGSVCILVAALIVSSTL